MLKIKYGQPVEAKQEKSLQDHKVAAADGFLSLSRVHALLMKRRLVLQVLIKICRSILDILLESQGVLLPF